jgi:hypothetical protein
VGAFQYLGGLPEKQQQISTAFNSAFTVTRDQVPNLK